MSNEQLLTIIISIAGATITLAGLILVQSRAIRSELLVAARERGELRARMDSQIGELRARMDSQIGELRERMAHLEGLLEGLREAITRQPAA